MAIKLSKASVWMFGRKYLSELYEIEDTCLSSVNMEGPSSLLSQIFLTSSLHSEVDFTSHHFTIAIRQQDHPTPAPPAIIMYLFITIQSYLMQSQLLQIFLSLVSL